MAISGVGTYAQYGKEDTFKTEAGTIDSAFGKDVKVTGKTIKRNYNKHRGIGNRNVLASTPGLFEGEVKLDFTLANSHWMAALLGSSSSSAAGSAYDHTYSEADKVPSMTIEYGHDLSTDSSQKLLGAIIDRATINCSVGNPITISLSILYANETEGTVLDNSPATDSEAPMYFAQGSINVGGVIARVQEVNLEIGNATKMVYGIGSTMPTDHIENERSYDLNVKVAFEDAVTFLEKVYGSATQIDENPSETATVTITFTNGLSDEDERTVVITLTGVKFDTHDIPSTPEDLVIQGVDGFARTAQIVGTDNTATTVWD